MFLRSTNKTSHHVELVLPSRPDGGAPLSKGVLVAEYCEANKKIIVMGSTPGKNK